MRTDELITTIEELDQLAAKLCAIRWHRKLPDDTDLKSGLFGALNSLGAECGFLVQKLENERIAAEEAAIPS